MELMKELYGYLFKKTEFHKADKKICNEIYKDLSLANSELIFMSTAGSRDDATELG